jgi:hypothetical protein
MSAKEELPRSNDDRPEGVAALRGDREQPEVERARENAGLIPRCRVILSRTDSGNRLTRIDPGPMGSARSSSPKGVWINGLKGAIRLP